jgi:hypothetical protein
MKKRVVEEGKESSRGEKRKRKEKKEKTTRGKKIKP